MMMKEVKNKKKYKKKKRKKKKTVIGKLAYKIQCGLKKKQGL